MKQAPQFTDLTRLTKALRIWNIVAIAVSLELAFENLRVYWIVNHPQQYRFTPGDTIWQYGIYIASMLLSLITFILLMVWVFKSYRNAKLISADATTSPAMAVVYYFIPFLSLYKPYQNMQEVWKICSSPTDWRLAKGGSIVVGWWSLYLLSGVTEMMALRSEPGENDPLTAYNAYYLMNASAQLLDAISCGLAALLVGKLWERMQSYAPDSNS